MLIFVASFSLSIYAGLDAVMPKYRGTGITIAEFAENYNDYASVPYAENTYILGSDGNWICNFTESPEEKRPDFTYRLNKSGEIIEISYTESLKTTDPVLILPKYCEEAIGTIVGSRPESTYKDIAKLPEVLESQWYSKLQQNGGESEGSFAIRDVTIVWHTAIENCKFISYGTLIAEDDTVMSYDLKLTIQFGS